MAKEDIVANDNFYAFGFFPEFVNLSLYRLERDWGGGDEGDILGFDCYRDTNSLAINGYDLFNRFSSRKVVV